MTAKRTTNLCLVDPFRDRRNEFDHSLSDRGRGNFPKGNIQLPSFIGRQKCHDGIIQRDGIVFVIRGAQFAEEIGNRDAENLSNMAEPAGANTIGALFILLHLLKRDAESRSKCALAHADHLSAQQDALSNLNVYWMRLLRVHLQRFPLVTPEQYNDRYVEFTPWLYSLQGDQSRAMMIRETFAANLRDRRTAQNISQEELAHRAGLDRTYISSLERCIYSPTIDVVQKIADVLDTTAADLLKLRS